MNNSLVERIVQAVLYEGYILYPYRPSSVKNRQRWTFGGLYPRCYSEIPGHSEPWSMQTQCLLTGDGHTILNGSVRFLHLMDRRVAEVHPYFGNLPEYRFVETMTVGDRRVQAWQEAVERTVPFDDIELGDLVARPRRRYFTFAPSRSSEEVRDQAGQAVGMIVREQQEVVGTVELNIQKLAARAYRLTVRIENHSYCPTLPEPQPEEGLMRSLASTHTILGIRNGEYVSAFDPPDEYRDFTAGCQNAGTWPVLVGEEGACDTILSSPIILYDYPQVAPESPGDLFDATEIDEILTLRILALTDDEKRAMVAVDERARDLLERTEALSNEQMMGLHGAIRSRPPRNGEHDG